VESETGSAVSLEMFIYHPLTIHGTGKFPYMKKHKHQPNVGKHAIHGWYMMVWDPYMHTEREGTYPSNHGSGKWVPGK